jgi:hypothetical protein
VGKWRVSGDGKYTRQCCGRDCYHMAEGTGVSTS